LDDDVVHAITSNIFDPVKKLQWRNSVLQFGSVGRLIQTLEERTDDSWLTRVRESDDLQALKAVSQDAEASARATDGPSVRLLWDVCRIPDFRGISNVEHATLLTDIYNFLHESGKVPDDWLAARVNRIDRTDGDIDALSKRLAYIRTWTYVAQRKGWVHDESHWREATRAVEDRLSDALHTRLTQRFVDRRTSVLLRRLNQKEGLVADVNDKGEVTVEGQFVGKIEGFRFRQDSASSPVGKLVRGDDPLKPRVEAFVDDEAGAEVAEKVQRRLQHFIDRKIAAAFEPMIKMQNDDALSGLAKGFAFRLVEGFGVIPRGEVATDVKALDQDARGSLRKHGVRFGQFTIFMPLLLKPAPTRLRLVMWSLVKGLQDFPEAPPPGLVTVPTISGLEPGTYAMSGYRAAGDRAIRIDMLERLADFLRDQDTRSGFEATSDLVSMRGLNKQLKRHHNLCQKVKLPKLQKWRRFIRLLGLRNVRLVVLKPIARNAKVHQKAKKVASHRVKAVAITRPRPSRHARLRRKRLSTQITPSLLRLPGSNDVDGTPVSKPSRAIASGVVLTFPKESEIRVIKVIACGERRGPAPEAQALYEDLSPKNEVSKNNQTPNPRFEGRGRPTKRDRRAHGLNKTWPLE